MQTIEQPISLATRLDAYARLIRLDRPIGTLLLLWPTLWALWIAANGIPDLHILVVFTVGVLLMRSAGCAINDFADREIDGHVARTANRPLATGVISPAEAIAVFAVLGILSFLLVLSLNTLTIWMSVPGILLAASYPFMKRFHHLPQVHLGIAFAWAVPMAFTAVTGELPTPVGWLVFLAFVLWTVWFDTLYAMADKEEDLMIGVKSTAILFGDADRLIVGALQVLTFFALIMLGREADLQWPYYLSLVVAAVMALYQQFLVRQRQSAECMRAFLNNNYVGLVVFAGIVIDRFLFGV